MPSKIRLQRISDRIRNELSEMLVKEVQDPRLTGISVTDVKVDRELAYADVFVSAVEGQERSREVLEGLHSASGFLRHALIDARGPARLSTPALSTGTQRQNAPTISSACWPRLRSEDEQRPTRLQLIDEDAETRPRRRRCKKMMRNSDSTGRLQLPPQQDARISSR